MRLIAKKNLAMAVLALAGAQATEENRFKVTLAERTLAAALSDARR